mgnify:CR=1 FL=1
MWALNRYDQFIHRIDPANNTIALSKQLGGSGHYGHSDMTGFILARITSRRGTWNVVHDAGLANALWGRIQWSETLPAGTSVHVEARSSNDSRLWSDGEAATYDRALSATPPGRYLEVQVNTAGGPMRFFRIGVD